MRGLNKSKKMGWLTSFIFDLWCLKAYYCVCSKITRPSEGTWKFRIGSICLVLSEQALVQETPRNQGSNSIRRMHQKCRTNVTRILFNFIFSEDGPNLVKRDKSITISLGQGPFHGSIGIGLVHTMSNMLNKTIQVANSPKRQLFQGMTNIL